MLKFNDYLKEAALSAKQKKIAAIAGDKDKIDAADLKALRDGKKPVDECDYGKMKKEELVGKQHKLDKNHNGKLDAQDFKMLRKEEADLDEDVKYIKRKDGKLHAVDDREGPIKNTHLAKDAAYVQTNLTKHLRKHAGLSHDAQVYFDDADLVHGDKTVVHNAIHPKSKHTVGNLVDALKKHTKGVKEEVQLTEALHKDFDHEVDSHIPKSHEHSHYDHKVDMDNHSDDDDSQWKDGAQEYADSQEHHMHHAEKAHAAGDAKKMHHHLAKFYGDSSDYHHFYSHDKKGDEADHLQAHHEKLAGKDHVKEEVELDEGRMKDLDYDLKNMGHDEFHKQYGHPKHHYDPTNFKKPVEPGKGMDRARALAQRGMQSLSKEEVERIEEKLTQLDELSKKTLGSYVKKASGDLASSIHYERDAEENDDPEAAGVYAQRAGNRISGLQRAGKKIAKEEVSAEMSPYLKATLQVMDEGKIDNLRDAQKLRQDTQSAYDKNYKPDTSHPHIQVVKGTAYGGENQKDDVNSDENPVKKYDKGERGRPAGYKTGAMSTGKYVTGKAGRGRPVGSKSGARQKGGGHEDGGIPVHNLNLPKSYK